MSAPARLSRTTTFWVVVAAYLSLMIAASTPSPLYVVYQAKWHFPTSTLTVIFGVYAVALLLSLLTVGGLSDLVGRRPMLIGCLGLLAASMVVFAAGQGVAWLFVARIMQGLAAGAAIGTLSAGIVELAPSGRERLATLLNALVPSIGLGLGALIAVRAPAPGSRSCRGCGSLAPCAARSCAQHRRCSRRGHRWA